jgi:hypothetical protein
MTPYIQKNKLKSSLLKQFDNLNDNLVCFPKLKTSQLLQFNFGKLKKYFIILQVSY